jgi:hypothetical protein
MAGIGSPAIEPSRIDLGEVLADGPDGSPANVLAMASSIEVPTLDSTSLPPGDGGDIL